MNKDQFTNYLQNMNLLNADSIEELNHIVQKFPYCQSAHILLTLNLHKEENILYNASLKKTAVYAGNRRRLKFLTDQISELEIPIPPVVEEEETIEDQKPASISENADAEEKSFSKSKKQLLDDFIKNQPSITRNKEQFYSAAEASKKSIVDQEEIVSETLANIYFDQKHYLKAIKLYKKLSLKYPEKSIYFAALIEKAQKEVKT